MRTERLHRHLGLPARIGYRPPGGHADIWLLRATPHLAAVARGDIALLSPEEQNRVRQLPTPHSQDTYLVAHLALRTLLGSCLGQPPAEVALARADCPLCQEPHGRPILQHTSGLHFSLSHVRDLITIGLARTPIGVDIEATDRVRHETLARRLHPAEHAAIEALPAARRHDALVRCWTRKEAYLKGLGTGLATPPNQVNVGTGLAQQDDEELAVRNGWTLTAITAPAGYAASLALLLPPGTRNRTTVRTRTTHPRAHPSLLAANGTTTSRRTITRPRVPEPLRSV
ncbi:4'-phosphopantetheinyl transferase superfamily protein [Streptomyces sp. NPDC048411]|uniref:4'-phosphopantetheinyl transferase family protein n=1 Tax=Streptomyces sp. NPDC048411 TaxID=3157206 RepID=UPI003451F861